MNKKIDNKFVPSYFPNDLPWYERDGLMTQYDQVKCEQFLEDTDAHFQNLKNIKFDIINSKGRPKSKLKQYQTVNHREILSYPPDLQDEIIFSIFRVKRNDMFVKREVAMEHFKKSLKSVGRGRFIKKIEIFVIKKLGRKM